ncbi:MAG: hypothetical protein HKP09_08880 [Enterobacterales bacterium]|nr:hypothetical protein [Enterobacterales bacterium]
MKKTCIIVLLFAIAGCSNKAMYDNLLINQRQACLKERPGLFEECMNKAHKTYEEYERERKELLEETRKNKMTK